MKRIRRSALSLCFLGSIAAVSSAQVGTEVPAAAVETKGKPIVLGHERTVESKVLGETRTLRVALPDGYAESKLPCGVLYLLDGESLFIQGVGATRHHSENDVLPMIVVGIDNTQRTRDLTPPAGEAQTADFPSSGGSATFRRFLIDEVRPFIEANYRTNQVRVLAGHSFGGLFAAETLITEPDAFTGYLILSPSFWWNEKALVERLQTVPHDHGMFDRFAFFGMGEEDGLMNGPYEEATWSLKNRAPARFRWARQTFPGHDHWPAALPALGEGIREFFAPLRQMSEGVTTFAELEAKAKGASDMYGETILVGRDAVSSAMRRLGQQGNTEAGLALVDAALVKLTDEPYLFYARADLLGGDERYAEAIATLERGIERFAKDPKHEQPMVWFKRSLTAMKGKLEKQ